MTVLGAVCMPEKLKKKTIIPTNKKKHNPDKAKHVKSHGCKSERFKQICNLFMEIS